MKGYDEGWEGICEELRRGARAMQEGAKKPGYLPSEHCPNAHDIAVQLKERLANMEG